MSYSFKINGQEYSFEENKRLLPFLRDTLELTATKNGCNEGACGACMVILDEKLLRACLLDFKNINGKSITTVEGLSEREKRVYAYAFSHVGAVQCGFCIPGMVISAKYLLDRNDNPSSEEVKAGLKGNICRCTGYTKIEEAIMLAAKIFRENLPIQSMSCDGDIEDEIKRAESIERTLGTGKYVDDIKLDNMAYGAAIRSKYPRAMIQNIDFDDALNIKDIIGIITAEDIPGERFIGEDVKDSPILVDIGEETRYIGDAIALVVAKTKKALRQAVAMIKVDYEVLDKVTSTSEALKDNATFIHENGNIAFKESVTRGQDTDQVIRNSRYSVTKTYKVPPTEYGVLEPDTVIALPENKGIKLYTSSKSTDVELGQISAMLNVGKDKVREINRYVGNGIGKKEDISVRLHASLMAYIFKCPVKMSLTRNESFLVHPKRHSMAIEITTACDERGKLTAMKAKIIADTGAYASISEKVLKRTCTHATGPYNCDNFQVEGLAVYTNNVPAGTINEFGITQTSFALESNLNLLAEKVGISPWEIRYENAIRQGNLLPNREIVKEGNGLLETLLAVKDDYEKSKFVGIASSFVGESRGNDDKITYGYGTHLVILDSEGKLKKVIAAHNILKFKNDVNVSGDIHGGIVKGLGYGLTEEFVLENGVPKVKYGTLGLLRASQIPEIETIIVSQDENQSEIKDEIKGIAEFTCNQAASALQGAYYKLDGNFRTSLPLKNTPYNKQKKEF